MDRSVLGAMQPCVPRASHFAVHENPRSGRHPAAASVDGQRAETRTLTDGRLTLEPRLPPRDTPVPSLWMPQVTVALPARARRMGVALMVAASGSHPGRPPMPQPRLVQTVVVRSATPRIMVVVPAVGVSGSLHGCPPMPLNAAPSPVSCGFQETYHPPPMLAARRGVHPGSGGCCWRPQRM